MNYFPILLLFIGGLILTAGDLVMKKWVITPHFYLYIIGLLIYMIGMMFLVETYKYENIAVASLIFIIFNIITLLIFSWFYFKETLTTHQIIGIILGLSAIFFFEGIIKKRLFSSSKIF